MNLDAVLEKLVGEVPEAIGAIICDYEGETVVTALGPAAPPEEAERRAMEHVPRAMALTMPVSEFLMRLAGAEPCGLLRTFDRQAKKRGGGRIKSLFMRYEAVEVMVDQLPNDYYLVLVLRRPALAGHARYHLADARDVLAPYVE